MALCSQSEFDSDGGADVFDEGKSKHFLWFLDKGNEQASLVGNCSICYRLHICAHQMLNYIGEEMGWMMVSGEHFP